MSNYISINNQRIELTEEQVQQILAAHKQSGVKLHEIPVGETFKIGEHELIVLEHSDDTTAVIRRDLLPDTKFGSSNNYDGSFVDNACSKFADDISEIVGEGNVVLHTVDLTSNDGLRDYGKVSRRASALTASLYRRYVETLDKFKQDNWWWLATPFSTAKHDNELWDLCVSPSGFINYGRYGGVGNGVRPFCILKSDIFVSR